MTNNTESTAQTVLTKMGPRVWQSPAGVHHAPGAVGRGRPGLRRLRAAGRAADLPVGRGSPPGRFRPAVAS
jgi:hypothetical protein